MGEACVGACGAAAARPGRSKFKIQEKIQERRDWSHCCGCLQMRSTVSNVDCKEFMSGSGWHQVQPLNGGLCRQADSACCTLPLRKQLEHKRVEMLAGPAALTPPCPAWPGSL